MTWQQKERLSRDLLRSIIVPETISRSQNVRDSLRLSIPFSVNQYSSYSVLVSTSSSIFRMAEMRVIGLAAKSKSPADGVETQNCTFATAATVDTEFKKITTDRYTCLH